MDVSWNGERCVCGRGAARSGYAHVIKEDRLNPNVLFLGTEFGLYVSLNAGQSWAQFRPNNFPDGVAVRDIALQDREDDLVLATHGRGMWVIDDIAPLRALNAKIAVEGQDARKVASDHLKAKGLIK